MVALLEAQYKDAEQQVDADAVARDAELEKAEATQNHAVQQVRQRLIKLTVEHLKNRLVDGARVVKCLPVSESRGEVFRTDASATDEEAVPGGWESINGKLPTEARWFSIKITKEKFPDLLKGGDPKRVVAAMELLATLVAMDLFAPPRADREFRGSTVATGVTDNRGNPFAFC